MRGRRASSARRAARAVDSRSTTRKIDGQSEMTTWWARGLPLKMTIRGAAAWAEPARSAAATTIVAKPTETALIYDLSTPVPRHGFRWSARFGREGGPPPDRRAVEAHLAAGGRQRDALWRIQRNPPPVGGAARRLSDDRETVGAFRVASSSDVSFVEMSEVAGRAVAALALLGLVAVASTSRFDGSGRLVSSPAGYVVLGLAGVVALAVIGFWLTLGGFAARVDMRRGTRLVLFGTFGAVLLAAGALLFSRRITRLFPRLGAIPVRIRPATTRSITSTLRSSVGPGRPTPGRRPPGEAAGATRPWRSSSRPGPRCSRWSCSARRW